MTDQAESTIEAIKEEIKSIAVSRFSSPFVGAFIVSWLLWNHRLMFTLFSSVPLSDRFKYIDETLYPSFQLFFGYNIAGPLFSTLIYIFVIPWPTEWVHNWNLHRKLRLRYAELRSEGKRLISEEESHSLKESLADMRAKLEERRRDLIAARRKISAIAMLNVDRLSKNDAIHVCHEYLFSQNFKFHSSGQSPSNVPEIHFARDHSVDLPGYKNVRWAFSDQKLRLFDTDKDLAEQIGEYRFLLGKHLFEGTLVNSKSTIVGIYRGTDFEDFEE